MECSIDPSNAGLVIANPIQGTYSFPNPSKMFNTLTFEFYSHRPLALQQDQFECFIDYTQPFMTLQYANG